MLKRHKVLIGTILEAPKAPTRTELMKWLFLLKNETVLSQEQSFYDFVPYKYGPFSFTVFRDLRKLAHFGYWNGKGYAISTHFIEDVREAFRSLPFKFRDAVWQITRRYGHLSQNTLLSQVYEKYPLFATRSELVNTPKVFVQKKKAIYTAGYEGESIEFFLQKLLGAGIERVIDVRSNPLARKYGFSKKSLKRLSGKLDIEYIHIPDLGIPSSYRKSLNTFEDYQKLMEEYDNYILPKATHARREASSLLQERPSALVCYEADIRCCHRNRLANALSSDTGIEVVHL